MNKLHNLELLVGANAPDCRVHFASLCMVEGATRFEECCDPLGKVLH
jgi:hypothetical protein